MPEPKANHLLSFQQERPNNGSAMTAGSAEAAGAMKSQDTLENKPPGPAPPSRRRGRRRRRKPPPELTVKGRLRMRSPSGAFVIVGISVVLVGMTIAVVGYWPHRSTSAAGSGASSGNSSSTGGIRREVKAPARSHHLSYTEKLKLIGPVIMGIGLFIFICANTMLYENRDMETRLLMQKGLYAMTLGLPQVASPEERYFQRRTSLPILKANAECVEGCYEVDLSSSGFQSRSSPGNKWADCYGPNKLQTTAQLLHHKGHSPAISLLSIHSGSGNSMEGNLNLSFAYGAESVISSAVNTLPLPVIKLNNCLPKKQAVARGAGEEGEGSPAKAPAELPRHLWTPLPSDSSVSPKNDLQGSHVVVNMDVGPPPVPASEELLPPKCTKKEFSSDVQLHNPGHSKSLDLGRPGVLLVAPIKDRKNRSWPRLDQISLVGFAKLESTGESSDQLLERTEQQSRDEPRPSSWQVGTELGTGV
uniref:Transmembrane protein 200B n=2 Tax=Crocodylus porosus TaxID=8502 RepID=A0A7M4FHB1_CROPO